MREFTHLDGLAIGIVASLVVAEPGKYPLEGRAVRGFDLDPGTDKSWCALVSPEYDPVRDPLQEQWNTAAGCPGVAKRNAGTATRIAAAALLVSDAAQGIAAMPFEAAWALHCAGVHEATLLIPFLAGYHGIEGEDIDPD